MITHCILVHYHEIAIKGKNRKWFESIFENNLKKQLLPLPFECITSSSARLYIFGVDPNRWDEYSNRLKCVMGLANATLMVQINAELDKIKTSAENFIAKKIFSNFRISARRQYKNYPMTSNEINVEVGSHIQNICNKPVKLKNADVNIYIEIVKGMAYLGTERIHGFGGLPVGVSETGVSLLSSGIDSPVASFEMLKRGMNLTYIHFHSAPATSRQSIKNVEELLLILSKYQMKCMVHFTPLLDIQKKIMADVQEKYWVLLFRRAMVKLASMVANNIHAPVLITGESVGQVASQTISNISVVSAASKGPILRPLAGHNKEDIINRAKQIGTYDKSVEPYQDCCSFFVPLHPETKANHQRITEMEDKLDLNHLLEDAVQNSELKIIKYSE